MSPDPAVLSLLIDDVYEAAVRPEAWPRFLTRLAEAVGGATAAIFFRLPDTDGPAELLFEPPLAEEYLLDFEERVNPWQQEVLRRNPPPRPVFSELDFFTPAELERTVLYEWARPQGMGANMGAAIPRADGGLSGFGVVAERSRGFFGSEDLDLAEAVAPHVARALEVREQLGHKTRQLQAVEATLDGLRTGVVILDERGRILARNRAAAAIAAENDGLLLTRDGVRASSPKQSGHLRRLVSEAIETTRGQGLAPGGALALARPSGRRPLQAIVTPLWKAGLPPVGPPAAAALFVVDPEQPPSVAPAGLIRLFGLTPAEARLAARLAAGDTLAAAGAALHIRPDTARNQLKAVFAKTDTHRQAELVALLLRSAGPLDP